MSEAVAERLPHLVGVAGSLQEVRVRAQRDRRIRVPELARNVHRVELEADDQHRGEAVARDALDRAFRSIR